MTCQPWPNTLKGGAPRGCQRLQWGGLTPGGRASCLQRGRSGHAGSGQWIWTESRCGGREWNRGAEGPGLSLTSCRETPRLWQGQGCPGSAPGLHVESDRPGSKSGSTYWPMTLAGDTVTLTYLGLPRTTWAGEPSAWCPAHSRCSLNGGAAAPGPSPPPGLVEMKLDQHSLVAASPLLVFLHRCVRADFRSPAWPSRRPPCAALPLPCLVF